MTVRTMHQKEADLRSALTTLTEWWEQMAKSADARGDGGTGLGVLAAVNDARARAYRKAATDLRDVLRTGRVPHGLMTDAELEQHGTSEETAS